EITALPGSTRLMAAAVLGGLGLLIAGSRVLIIGAVGLAEEFGVSEAVIGLTLVAVGTSLPELTVGVMAALRRHADVAVGNILGSNIFNLLGILGVAALVEPLAVNPRILAFDQWVMLGAAVLLVWFLHTGRRVSRLEGIALLLCYAAYLWRGLVLG
ncbi:MAG TPA: sodium:calcium antiporter, partial [Azoarcus taiwanensis]|nr:sodium:calcium antiporter [Azoarcus taiwanensis]